MPICPTPDSQTKLLEGHIFSELKFKGNIISPNLAEAPGSVDAINAKKFAAKHGVKLVFV